MPHIRFTVHADCDSQEPCRIVPALRGEIFEFAGESDNEVRIGQIDAYLVLRGRALNEQESLFEAMDSIDSSVFECYEALFDPETDDWNQSVHDLYKDQIMGLKTVQGILRHAKIQTTLDLYTQEDSDETRAAQGEFLTAVGMNTTVN